VGEVSGNQWDDASIGGNSIAMGFSTTASGVTSTALGSGTFAFGTSSTAMGNGTSAVGYAATAMGYQTYAGGGGSTALGNATAANGGSSTAMGFFAAAQGDYSTAMGSYSSANGAGSFAFGDNSTTSVITAGANEFVVRAAGGVTFFSNSSYSTGAVLSAGTSSWASVSDRKRKENFQPVDAEAILGQVAALPVTSWNYKGTDPTHRYIGPMAQDFHALFGLGNDTTIATMDMDGVTLAAVQALEQRTREIARLREENAALEARIARLEALVNHLSQRAVAGR
jgi:hypothetical protein